MTYGNLPYPDFATLPLYLSQNQIERRPIFEDNEADALDGDPDHQPPPQQAPRDDEESRQAENKMDLASSSLPLLRMSNLLFSYDDPERTGDFFVPLMILLIVHALFLVYIHLYAPIPHQIADEGTLEGTNSLLWDYISLRGNNKYYDVDGLRSGAGAATTTAS